MTHRLEQFDSSKPACAESRNHLVDMRDSASNARIIDHESRHHHRTFEGSVQFESAYPADDLDQIFGNDKHSGHHGRRHSDHNSEGRRESDRHSESGRHGRCRERDDAGELEESEDDSAIDGAKDIGEQLSDMLQSADMREFAAIVIESLKQIIAMFQEALDRQNEQNHGGEVASPPPVANPEPGDETPGDDQPHEQEPNVPHTPDTPDSTEPPPVEQPDQHPPEISPPSSDSPPEVTPPPETPGRDHTPTENHESAKAIYIFPKTDYEWNLITNNSPKGSIFVTLPNDANWDSDRPFETLDPNIQRHISEASAAGMNPVGYVGTLQGTRSIDDIKAEIDSWYRTSDIKGIYLGNSSNPGVGGYATDSQSEAYYEEIARYVKTNYGGLTMINGSGTPNPDYMDSFDVQGTFEGDLGTYENRPSAAAWQYQYDADRFAAVVVGVQQGDLQRVGNEMLDNHNGYIFMQQDWGSVASTDYWRQAIDAIDGD